MTKDSRGMLLLAIPNTEGQLQTRISRVILGIAVQTSTEETTPVLQVLQGSTGIAAAALADRTTAADRRDHLTEEDSFAK